MSRDYDEIVSVVRKTTLGIRGTFTRAESKNDESPMGIYDKTFSRFPVVIINADKKASTGNITVEDAPMIFRNSELCQNKDFEMKVSNSLSKPNETESLSIAYTTKIPSGKLKGLSPAQLLLDNRKEELQNHYKWLIDNLSKYPNNKLQIDAIKEACDLYNKKALSLDKAKENSSAVSFTIYSTGMRPKIRETNDKGMCFIYEIDITWNFGDNYPVVVKVENYYAPVKKLSSGLLNVEKSKRDEKTIILNEMKLSASEWENIIYRMKMAMRNFEMINITACNNDCINAMKAQRAEAKKKNDESQAKVS